MRLNSNFDGSFNLGWVWVSLLEPLRAPFHENVDVENVSKFRHKKSRSSFRFCRPVVHSFSRHVRGELPMARLSSHYGPPPPFCLRGPSNVPFLDLMFNTSKISPRSLLDTQKELKASKMTPKWTENVSLMGIKKTLCDHLDKKVMKINSPN